MSKANGTTNGESTPLDIDHELTASDDRNEEVTTDTTASVATEAQSEVERLKSENAAYLDRLARLQAEFDNFRKRSVREQQEFRDYALVEALKQLLPILDSLGLALKTSSAKAEDFRSGVELIERQFQDTLARLGVEPIDAAGKEFNPNLHQAIQTLETNEVPENHVAQELQRGYKIKDRLLRPAMVLVAKTPEN